MYNESDMHTGCESCGKSITTYYTNNFGFYCDICIEEHYQSEVILKKDWSIFSEKLAAYIYRADCGNLKLSSIKYFKSSYFKTFLLFNKVDRTYMIRKAISAIRIMRSYRTWENSYSDQQEYITREILKLLLQHRR